MSFTFDTFKNAFALFMPRMLQDRTAKKRCVLAALIILVDIAASSLVPYFSKQIIDACAITPLGGVSISVLLLGLFWSLEKTNHHLQDILFFPVVNNTIRHLTFALVEHIHQIPLSEYQKLSVPELISSARRISASARAFIKILVLMILPTLVKLIITTFVAIRLGLFGWSLLFSFPLALFMVYRGTVWYVGTREKSWQASDEVVTRINDSILNTKIARFFEKFEMHDVGTLLYKETILWNQANIRLHTVPILLALVLGTTITGILYFALLSVQNQTLTIGEFVMLKGQLMAAFLPLKTLSLEFRQLAESVIDIKKVKKILDIPIQKKLAFSLTPLPTTNAISFNNLTFSYEGQKPLFKEFNCSIMDKEKILVVGQSGCGKSSLLNLITGLYKPQKGSIWIYGREISYLATDTISKLICFIPQDFRLFNQSIRYNLTYGLPSLSEQEIHEALELSGLNTVILKLQEGLETVVGEMGTKLSGGERQLIALTRALLLKPKILLLDETTHSLNKNKEEKVLKALFKVIPTVVIVSHRKITLPSITRILTLENGKLTEKYSNLMPAIED
jgi:ABC-type multidrug transport system fused ATPase/permease subunit